MTRSSMPTATYLGAADTVVYRGPEPHPKRPGEIQHPLYFELGRNRWFRIAVSDHIFNALPLVVTGAKKVLSDRSMGFFPEATTLPEVAGPSLLDYLEHVRTIAGNAIAEPANGTVALEDDSPPQFGVRYGGKPYPKLSPLVIDMHLNDDYEPLPWDQCDPEDVGEVMREWLEERRAEK